MVWGSMVRLESSVAPAPRILTLSELDVCTSDVTGFQTGKRLSLYGVPNRTETDFVGLKAMAFSQNQTRREFKHKHCVNVDKNVNIHTNYDHYLKPLMQDVVGTIILPFEYHERDIP